MYSFDVRMGSAVSDTGTKGWLVAILELGAWFGVLCTGYLADKLSRKRTIVLGKPPSLFSRKWYQRLMGMCIGLAVVVFCIGVIVQTSAFHPSSIFGGEHQTRPHARFDGTK